MTRAWNWVPIVLVPADGTLQQVFVFAANATASWYAWLKLQRGGLRWLFWGKSLQTHRRGAGISRWGRGGAAEAAKLGKIGTTGRLHSVVGYLTPRAMLKGCDQAILAKRDRKLEVARESRKQQRQAARQAAMDG